MGIKSDRRLPSYQELRSMVSLGRGSWVEDPLTTRAHSVSDVRELARRRTPRPIFDFVDGGAEREISMIRAAAAYSRAELTPRALTGLASVDPSTTLLGEQVRAPLALAPTGFTRLMHAQGEPAVAAAAGAGGVPYTLSTFASASVEQVRAATGTAPFWFQLYVLRDRDLTRSLVARAEAGGADALVVTIDTAVAGKRLRDFRNGLSVPPKITPRTMTAFARKPRWVTDFLTAGPLELPAMPHGKGEGLWQALSQLADPTLTMQDIQDLRAVWPRSLVVKGVLDATTARQVVDLGADAVVVSSHGGRQLEQTPAPLDVLPSVVAAVGGRAEVFIDSGIRSGTDMAIALALGADGCLVGRPYLYGLMAAGQRGVERVIALLTEELARTMHLLGVADVTELRAEGKHLVDLHPRQELRS